MARKLRAIPGILNVHRAWRSWYVSTDASLRPMGGALEPAAIALLAAVRETEEFQHGDCIMLIDRKGGAQSLNSPPTVDVR